MLLGFTDLYLNVLELRWHLIEDSKAIHESCYACCSFHFHAVRHLCQQNGRNWFFLMSQLVQSSWVTVLHTFFIRMSGAKRWMQLKIILFSKVRAKLFQTYKGALPPLICIPGQLSIQECFMRLNFWYVVRRWHWTGKALNHLAFSLRLIRNLWLMLFCSVLNTFAHFPSCYW